MRLKGNTLGFVVNFLLGVAWATAFIGAFSAFSSYYSESIPFAIISAFIAALPGMIGLLFLEHFITSKEKHSELLKQTKLLEEIKHQASHN